MYHPNPIMINNDPISRKNLIKLRTSNLENEINKNSVLNIENTFEMWNKDSFMMTSVNKEKTNQNIMSNLLNLTSKKKNKFSKINVILNRNRLLTQKIVSRVYLGVNQEKEILM